MASIELIDILSGAATGDADTLLTGTDAGTIVKLGADEFATQDELDALVISGGGISVASDAEAKAATNNTKAMTPAKVKVALPFVTLHPSGDTTGATDLAAINAALVASPNVRLAPGTFYVNKSGGEVVKLAASGRHFSGSGKDVTTLYCVSGSNAPGGVIGWGVGSLSNITISDMTIDANKAGNTGTPGIVLVIATNATVERCRIKNTSAQGIHVYLGANFTAVDNDFVDIGDANTTAGEHAGILCQETVGTRIEGNRIDGCTDTGILADGGPGVLGSNTIVGNHVEDCYWIGIGLGGDNDPLGGPHVISGNTVKGCVDSNSIDTGDACNLSVAGNTLIGGQSGICHDSSLEASSVTNLSYVGNTIRDTATSAILVIGNQTTPHSAFTIVGNTIYDCGNHGIGVSGFKQGTISGNQVSGVAAAYAGIYLNGPSAGVTDVVVTGNGVFNADNGVQTSGASNNWNLVTVNNLRTCTNKLVGSFGANSITTGNMV
jgi:hypothetical protein